MSLPLALLRCLRRAFIAPFLPRLFLIIFRYSQPSLIRQSIQFVTASNSAVSDPESRGYWLVVSAVTIYVGLAVSLAVDFPRVCRAFLTLNSKGFDSSIPTQAEQAESVNEECSRRPHPRPDHPSPERSTRHQRRG